MNLSTLCRCGVGKRLHLKALPFALYLIVAGPTFASVTVSTGYPTHYGVGYYDEGISEIFGPSNAGAILIRVPTTYRMALYFPLRSGTFWTYRYPDSSTYTMRVEPGTTLINGVATKAVSDTDGYTQYLTNDNEGIRLHGQMHAPSSSSIIYLPPIKLADAYQDDTRTVISNGTAQTDAGDFAYASSFALWWSDDVVTVPLRTFRTLLQMGTITIAGSAYSYRTNLAPGVGIVKEQQSLYPAPDSLMELIATNAKTVMDLDGDGRGDVSIYRNGSWIYQPSSGGTNVGVQFGGGTDTPVPADYDGDGKTDIAVYRNGLWVYRPSLGGSHVAVHLGGGTDVPVPGDYDGDGKTDVAVYRDGLWINVPSSGGANVAVQFGGGSDVPMPGDYDGDGKTDIAVYRSGLWIYQPSSGGANVGVFFGGGTDVPVPADYDGDGKTDLAIYRNGLWVYRPSSGGADVATFFGGGTDIPVPADYDGDGKTDLAIFRNGLWVYKPSSGGADVAVFFGSGSDVPLP